MPLMSVRRLACSAKLAIQRFFKVLMGCERGCRAVVAFGMWGAGCGAGNPAAFSAIALVGTDERGVIRKDENGK